MQLNRLRLPRMQCSTHSGMKAGPYIQLFDKQIAHSALDVTITDGKLLGTVREGLDEASLVALPEQAQCKRLLAALDDVVRTQHKYAGDQFDGYALLEQIHHKDSRGNELQTALQIDTFSEEKREVGS